MSVYEIRNMDFPITIKKVKDKSWLDLHNSIVDLNSDYIFYEERNGDDTIITQGVVSSYIAKEMGDLK